MQFHKSLFKILAHAHRNRNLRTSIEPDLKALASGDQRRIRRVVQGRFTDSGKTEDRMM